MYSAVGSHAMYATPGVHNYILPLGLLHDTTDRGPLWDPVLNSQTYIYSPRTSTLHPTTRTPSAPTAWFFFSGHWGDKVYRLTDSRQYMVAGNYHYESGPLGPRDKNLGRRDVCGQPKGQECEIRDRLDTDDERKRRVRVFPGNEEGRKDVRQNHLAFDLTTHR